MKRNDVFMSIFLTNAVVQYAKFDTLTFIIKLVSIFVTANTQNLQTI